MTNSINIAQDWVRNKGNTKGKFITILFRLGFFINSNRISKVILFPYTLLYKIVVEWVLGVDLPCTTVVGKGLIIYHGQAMVIHKNTVIGNNCSLRQSTTIGTASPTGKSPVIGNNVDIGCNVCIIGEITIGDNVIVGAGTVITKSVPAGCIVVGNPSRIIKEA
jgi:putative colanic acid biosynthesis acetyltransferase WcaB